MIIELFSPWKLDFQAIYLYMTFSHNFISINYNGTEHAQTFICSNISDMSRESLGYTFPVIHISKITVFKSLTKERDERKNRSMFIYGNETRGVLCYRKLSQLRDT